MARVGGYLSSPGQAQATAAGQGIPIRQVRRRGAGGRAIEGLPRSWMGRRRGAILPVMGHTFFGAVLMEHRRITRWA